MLDSISKVFSFWRCKVILVCTAYRGLDQSPGIPGPWNSTNVSIPCSAVWPAWNCLYTVLVALRCTLGTRGLINSKSNAYIKYLLISQAMFKISYKRHFLPRFNMLESIQILVNIYDALNNATVPVVLASRCCGEGLKREDLDR